MQCLGFPFKKTSFILQSAEIVQGSAHTPSCCTSEPSTGSFKSSASPADRQLNYKAFKSYKGGQPYLGNKPPNLSRPGEYIATMSGGKHEKALLESLGKSSTQNHFVTGNTKDESAQLFWVLLLCFEKFCLKERREGKEREKEDHLQLDSPSRHCERNSSHRH